LLQVIPVIDPDSIGKIQYNAKSRFGMGQKKVRVYLDILVDNGQVFVHTFPRPGKKPEIKYAKTAQTTGP